MTAIVTHIIKLPDNVIDRIGTSVVYQSGDKDCESGSSRQIETVDEEEEDNCLAI